MWRQSVFVAAFGLLLAWVILSCYYAVKQQSSHQVPHVGMKILYITANCRWRKIGNAMFNYASLLGIAKKNGRIPVLPYDLSIRKMLQCPMRKGGFEFNFGMYLSQWEYGGRSGTYDPTTQHLPEFNMNLNGFYQSWKYFTNVEEELRTEHFVLLPEVEQKVNDHMHKHIPTKFNGETDLTFIGVHIRRGDMLQRHLLLAGYVAVSLEYFERAMAYFRNKYKKAVFYVCTDSPGWTSENIKGDDVAKCDGDPAVDFGILSRCNHSVLSVGSFGWWSAWLANGTTIYYSKWPGHGSRLDYEVTKADYFPPHWLPM